MEIGWGRQITTCLALIVITGAWSGPARAQEAGGSAFTLDGSIRSTVEFDDNGSLLANAPGRDLTFGTDLDLTATLETPRSRLSFSIGATLQAEDLAAGVADNGLVYPSARLDYRLEGPNSLFTLSADYRDSNVANSFSQDTDEDLVNDLFLSSIGDIETFGVDLGLSFGLDAPFGMDLDLTHRERDYSNTVNPDLFDSSTTTARVTARIRASETATARIFAEERQYEAEDADQTDRTTRTMGVGLDYDINPVLSFSGDLGWTRVDETTIVMGLPVTEITEDVTIDASLTQEMRNGTFAVSLDQTVGSGIKRTGLEVERSIELPAGALSFALGLNGGDVGRTVWTGSLDYTRELPGATIGVSASRNARVASDNDQIATTRLGLTYDRDLTRTSGITFGLDVVDSEDIGNGSATEGTRSDLSLTYRQELTEDWDWTLGYVGRHSKPDTGSSATSNAIVFSVGRSFSLRP